MTKKHTLISLSIFVLFIMLIVMISHNYSLIKKIKKPEPPNRQIVNENIATNRQNAITEIIEECSPAIVGIHVTRIQKYTQNNSFNDPFFNHFFPPRIYKKKVKSMGSGVIISEDGLILTNAHVVGTNALEIVVTSTTGEKFNAKIIGIDDLSDIALLKINKKNCPFLKMSNSDEIIIGEWVVALGNPFGLFDLNFQPVATIGIISSTNLDFGEQQSGRVYQDMIQTDASINSGNSGGALVNVLGEIIGINTFIFSNTSSSGSIGIGFAIPINRVKEITDELVNNGKIDRGFDTGLIVQILNPYIINYLKIPVEYGVIITDIKRNSSAAKTNLQVGDVILEVNEHKVKNDRDIYRIINENYLRAGDNILLTVWREGKKHKINLPLEKSK